MSVHETRAGAEAELLDYVHRTLGGHVARRVAAHA